MELEALIEIKRNPAPVVQQFLNARLPHMP